MDIEYIKKVHSEKVGKLIVESSVKLDSKEILSAVYTPGVAEICKIIDKDQSESKKLTIAGKTVAVISDGSAVLGLGNIGPKAALPVMEGKCAIFKELGGVDAFPICLDTQDTEEIIQIVKAIAPNFAAINLEDISAPRCFEIEERLASQLDIPIMHDDQHGTAIVTLAALKGALKLEPKKRVKIVISGAGAAGTAITKLLSNAKTILELNIAQIRVFDSKGLVCKSREDLTEEKAILAELTNQTAEMELVDGIKESDVFIGVSAGNLLTKEMVSSMNRNPIIFALANPDPEILPDIAIAGGASIVGTGRSDFPNQINNALAYPGIFKGLIMHNLGKVDESIKLAASDAIFRYHVKNLAKESLLPSILDKEIPDLIAKAIA